MALLWWALGLHAALTLLMITSDDAVPFVLLLAVWTAIAFALSKRWRFARPIQTIFAAYLLVSVFGVYGSVHREPSFHVLMNIGFDIIRYGFNTAAAILFWTPSASGWFRSEGR
jgi:hypothetical protein